MCLCGCSLSGDDNESGGAISCQLLMLIVSDLWKKKRKKNGLSPGESCFRRRCIRGGFPSQRNRSESEGELRRQDEYSLPLCGVHTAYKMKIITPQVNQTGEVRLLSKLLNQKVDIVCCMCSRGKTLTVQGLWVCKKTGRSVEMHLQALGLLTFRYAYKTVLNQSKQKKKKRKKKGWSSAV